MKVASVIVLITFLFTIKNCLIKRKGGRDIERGLVGLFELMF